jgi:membrane-associated phospholipid phosphatase
MRLVLRRLVVLLSIGTVLPRGAEAQELVSRREAAAGAAVLVGALLLDRAVDGAVPHGGGDRLEPLSDALNHGGRPQYAVALLAGGWLAGELAGRDEVADAALRVGAGLLAAGVVNGALKYGVGRERPNETSDPLHFRPIGEINRWQSFPSGHATVAFAFAAGVSEEARRPWVTALAYGGAAAVAWSRVYEDKHWTSDVAAGALLGIVAGRGAVRLLRPSGDAPALALAPGRIGIRIPVR